jgi:RNA polymerase sigma-70 factor, ECF subfamily
VQGGVRESTPMPGFVSLESNASRVMAESPLEQSIELNRFLAGVERRAFRIAEIALRDREDALDVVQIAMMRLAESYGRRPAEEWKPLFFRILYNGIRDCQRRRTVRSKLFGWWPTSRTDDDDQAGREDPLEQIADGGPDPLRRVMAGDAMARLEGALAALPARQQEAFALRCLEGMDVEETATAMGCTAGSVKTHYFRALQTLRERLGEVW